MAHDDPPDPPVRLRAFVGRSFLEADKLLWHELRDILDSLAPLGFHYEDAKEAQLRPISEKVRSLISRNDIYIGVLTRRYPIIFGAPTLRARISLALRPAAITHWTTSEWVVEEIGFALGKGRLVLLLKEEGVVFPTTDLDADTQWVPFRRDKLSASQTELTQMIAGLISERVSTVEPPPAPVAAPTPDRPESTTTPKSLLSERLPDFFEHIEKSAFAEATKVQELILDETKDPGRRTNLDASLLQVRATHGDSSALSSLREHVADVDSKPPYIRALANVYASYKQYREAAELLLPRLDKVAESDMASFAQIAADALREDGNGDEALHLLRRTYRVSRDAGAQSTILRALASTATALKRSDLAAACLERQLQKDPANTSQRFDVAHVYGDSDRDALAAYHYQLLTEHIEWPSANNNLAVAYSSLRLKAHEIVQLQRVKDNYPLARANLAVVCATAGFLSEARELAKTVLTTPSDEPDAKIAIERAQYALEEANKLEKTEQEQIQLLADQTKQEREFMGAYADAYCDLDIEPFSAIFTTAQGDLQLEFSATQIKGHGSFQRTVQTGGALSAMFAGVRPKSELRTITFDFSAELTGRAASYELTVSEAPAPPPTLLGDSGKRTIKGILILESDRSSLAVLEHEGQARHRKTYPRKS